MEVTKDLETSLENSLLMQSLLENSSPGFLDRPLPDCLFSDEDSEKQHHQQAGELSSKTNRAANATAVSNCAKEAKEASEGIKLRLKLEKTETVNYVAVVNVPSVKSGPSSSSSTTSSSSDLLATTGPLSNSSGGSSPAEPRVPPLHISLKGRNIAVLNSPKKEIKQKKKSRSRHGSGEEDEFHRGKLFILPLYFSGRG